MSNEVDNRVVSMQFDNQRFEKNVATSLKTLDKLKTSLKLDGATKGLAEVDAAAKKIDLSGLSKSVETVGVKFSSLKVMAVTALANITNSAVNAGKRMVSALTIDPIRTGFQEYETQINSVQTILANTESKGSTLQDVNNALAELNTYADKTIYNFTEMTRNIGTFTAAGVDLKTSTAAIKGIANLAAVSGSTSQQASTAMYQLSQALSSGTVKLMDWNSVVNAGMGGQVFQDALKETARVHGINIDAMIKKEGSFRETLQNGWLSSEILTETLSKFTGDLTEEQLKQMGYTDQQIAGIVKMGKTANDAATKVKTFTQLFDTLKEAAQSGWTKTWEIIVGDFGEAKELLTEISDTFGGIIGESADSRNKLLGGALSSGWKQLLNEGITDAAGFEERIKEVAKNSGTDIDKIFNTEKVSAYGKAIAKIAEDDSNALGYTKEHVTAFSNLQKQFQNGTMSMDEFTKSASQLGINLDDITIDEITLQDTFKQGWVTTEILSESITKYGEKLKGMSKAELEAAGYTMKDVQAFEELEKKLKDGTISLEDFTNLLTRKSGRELLIEALRNALNGLMSAVTPIKKAFRDIFGTLESSQLYSIIQGFTEFTSKLTLNEERSEKLRRTFAGLFALIDIGIESVKAIGRGVLDLLNYFAPAGDGILDFSANLGDFLVRLRDSIKEGNVFGKVVDGIVKFITTVADGVKAMGKSISDTFGEISDKAEVRFEPLTVLGNALKAIFVGIGKVLGKILPSVANIAKGIGSLFSSIMEKISSSIQNADYNGLFDMLNGGVFSAIGIFIARFIKSGGDLVSNASGILENISDVIDGAKEALGAFTEQLKAKTLKELAIAIAILAASLLVISFIDSGKLVASLGAVAALFYELMFAMKAFSKFAESNSLKKLPLVATVMKRMATALLILAVAMKIMGSMSWGEMSRGLISITVGLGALVGAVQLLPEKDVNKAAKTIKKLSSAMVVFAIALKIMGSMSWSEMGVGLVSMASGLSMMVGAVRLLPTDTSKRAAGLFGLAAAMVVLGAAFKIMGSMSWGELGVGLVAMASGLSMMVGAVNLLPKDTALKTLGLFGLATAMVVLASALKIMGSMSWEEMGRGLLSMGAGLGAFVAVLYAMPNDAAGKAASILILSGAMVVLGAALKIMGSMSWGEIAKSLVAIAGAFVIFGVAAYALSSVTGVILSLSGAMALFGLGVLAIGVGVTAFATGIGILAVALASGGAAIVTFVASLISLIPFVIQQIGVGIVAFCNVIAGAGSAIFGAIKTVILSAVDAITECLPAIIEGFLKLIVDLLTALIDYLPQIVPLLVELFVKLIDCIVGHLPTIIEAVFRFIGALLMAIASNITKIIDPIVTLLGAIFEGIAAVIGPVVESVIAPLLEVVLDSFVKLFEVLEPHIPMICDLIAYLVTTITDGIVRIFEIIAPYMPEVTEIVRIVSDAVVSITDALVRLFEQVSPILDSISNLISEVSDSIAGALDSISGIIDSVGGVIKSWFDGIEGVIEAVGNAALNSGEGFKRLAEGIQIIVGLKLADLVASLGAVATGLGKIAKHSDGISETGAGMKKIADSTKMSSAAFAQISAGIANIIETLPKIGPAATQAMTTLTKALSDSVSGIKTISTQVTAETAGISTAIKSMAVSGVNAVKSLKGQFANAGKYLISGLANGIRANKPAATSAAREVAKAVESIIREAWKINSPSKVFYKIALGVGEGIKYAFGDSILGVKSSAKELGQTATDGFSNVVQQIAEFLSSDMDAQPTIRPVLDLSDVRSGANSIAGMFSGNRTLSISAPGIGAISASMASRQNGNNDLASAINKLAKSNGKSGNTYQINGINYNEGSDVADAIQTLVRAANIERRT